MASQGSIITRVYTSDAFLPLRDVPVVYTQTQTDGSKKLLTIQMTNSSGLTTPYYIETPEASNSLSPGSPLRPYSQIDIHVSSPGYNSILAEGVQIFPGVETIQGFQLRPILPSDVSSVTLPESTQNL